MAKICIVTPCLNAATHIAETIDSVISQQGAFSIQYVVVDGGSSDDTEAIVRERQQRLRHSPDTVRCKGVTLDWISQRDKSMYQALNRGFARTRGDVLAWINADDVYQSGAFEAVRRVFEQRPEVSWLKGVTDYIDAASVLQQRGELHLYQRDWLQAGVYGRELQFVQQDSVFWRTGLWRQIEGFPEHLRLAGDYWLWTHFARSAPLYSLDAHVSCFRRQVGQLSEDIDAYRQEMALISQESQWRARLARRFFGLERRLPGALFHRLCRWLTGGQCYHAVRLGTQGGIEVLSGEYMTVRSALACTSS